MSANPIRVSNIEDLALELGASVRRPDGTVFNAGGRSGASRLPVQPKPEAAPVPTGHAELASALADMMAKLHLQQPAPPVVNVPPAQVVVNPQPRTGWDFVFTRNQDGTIESIRATPVKE